VAPTSSGKRGGGEAHAERDPQHTESGSPRRGKRWRRELETRRGTGELQCSRVDIRLQRIDLEQRGVEGRCGRRERRQGTRRLHFLELEKGERGSAWRGQVEEKMWGWWCELWRRGVPVTGSGMPPMEATTGRVTRREQGRWKGGRLGEGEWAQPKKHNAIFLFIRIF
jgi:hypothetical protein